MSTTPTAVELALAVLMQADPIWVGDAMRKRQALTEDYEKLIFKVLDNLKEASAERIAQRVRERYVPPSRMHLPIGNVPTETPRPVDANYTFSGVGNIYASTVKYLTETWMASMGAADFASRVRRDYPSCFGESQLTHFYDKMYDLARPMLVTSTPDPEATAPVVLVPPPPSA